VVYIFSFVVDMQLVVFLVVKIRNHSGVLLLNALLDCLKTNQDMLWYKLDFSVCSCQVKYCVLSVIWMLSLVN
jgi:hypothetical protein